MIVVTGATGNIGTQLVKELQAAKAPFKVLTRDPKKAKDSLGNVEAVKGDLADAGSLAAAFKGADKLFLLVAAGPDMAKQGKGAIDAAKKAGVKQVVYLSSLGADPGSPVNLAKWHAADEKELKASGLSWTLLRPHFFMQNFLGDAGLKADGNIYAPMKDAKISLVDVRDIAAVAAKALTEKGHEGQTYSITGPEAVSYTQIASAFSEALGKKVTYVAIDDAKLREALSVYQKLPAWMVDDFSNLFAYFSSGAAAAVSPDVEKVTKRKAIPFPKFAKDHAAAWKK